MTLRMNEAYLPMWKNKPMGRRYGYFAAMNLKRVNSLALVALLQPRVDRMHHDQSQQGKVPHLSRVVNPTIPR